MGYSSYSSATRGAFTASVASKSENEIFTQNLERKAHHEMSSISLGIREARDSEVHPNTLPIIIALDVTGSMGRIPVNIIKDDLTHLMESLIHGIGIPDVAVLFLAIGDQKFDDYPLQVGQFESGDQELAKWLSQTYIEHGGGGDKQESYGLAWVVASKHTVTDSWEKRKQPGFLFTIGDEGFHEEYNAKKVFGSGQPSSTRDALKDARERYHVYHIHANHGNYPNNQAILGQWRDALGQNVMIANSDKEIIQKIVDTVKTVLSSNDASSETPVDSKKPETESSSTSKKDEEIL